ncbi:MAG: hypothetical protein HUK26_01735 [Duodenibacillus sp.]|nr:hypothetical protein [Duodenibacillus sp.]
MTCKYCALYVERGRSDIEGFEAACRILGLDAGRAADHEAIVNHLGAIGQFGAIRLARSFPAITDEKDFRTVVNAALKFYWLTMDMWEEIRAREARR